MGALGSLRRAVNRLCETGPVGLGGHRSSYSLPGNGAAVSGTVPFQQVAEPNTI